MEQKSGLPKFEIKDLTWQAKKQLGNTYAKLLKLANEIAKKAKIVETVGAEEAGFELLATVYEVLSFEDIEKLVNTLCENCELEKMSEIEIFAFISQVIAKMVEGQNKKNL